jgi:hypothetical protein
MSNIREREFYLNNADDDGVSVSELDEAIKEGIITFDELLLIIPAAKLEAVKQSLQPMNNQPKPKPQPMENMQLKTRPYYLSNVDQTAAKELAEAIAAGIVTFEELQETGDFLNAEQNKVKDFLKTQQDVETAMSTKQTASDIERMLQRTSLSAFDRNRLEQRLIQLKDEEELNVFNEAKTTKLLDEFINRYPSSSRIEEAHAKMNKLRVTEVDERNALIDGIIKNIHNTNHKVIIEKYGEDVLRAVCEKVELNYDDVKNIRAAVLDNSGRKPENVSDIPEENTDVFFWGMPSSGKSCAMASIFNTIRTEYAMIDPEKGKIFGRPYRASLSSIFNNNDIGYLPKGTAIDDTHYMNFVLKENDSNKRINLSFLEISGEIFKYFKLLTDGNNVSEDEKIRIHPTLNLLNSILKSKNPKIHFFFIDYQQESDLNGIIGGGVTQSAYLEAASSYFTTNDDIFKNHTLSIHIVITKADLLPGFNRQAEAEKFYKTRFKNFKTVIDELTDKYNMNKPITFPFTIGDVYFNTMCRLNREYPKKIVDKLLEEIKPKNAFWEVVKKYSKK